MGRIATHFVTAVSARLLHLAVSFGVNVIIANQLGPDGRGAYALFVTTATLGAMVVGMGFQFSVSWLVARKQVSGGQALLMSVLQATALFGAGLLFNDPIQRLLVDQAGLNATVAHLVVPGIVAALLIETLRSVILGQDRIEAHSVLRLVVPSAVAAGAFLALVILGGGLDDAVTVWLVANLIGIIVIIGMMRSAIPHLGLVTRRDVWRSIGLVGLRGWSINVLGLLLLKVDQYLLANYLGDYELGLYAIAMVFVELLLIVPSMVGLVMFPKVSADGGEKTGAITAQGVRITIAISVVAALFLTVFGYPLLVLLFRDEFTAAYPVLLWLLPGLIAFSGLLVVNNFLAGLGYPVALVAIILGGLGLNIGLNLLLLPRFGLSGAAAAKSVAYIATTLLCMVQMRTRTGIPLRRIIVADRDDLRMVVGQLRSIVARLRRRSDSDSPSDPA